MEALVVLVTIHNLVNIPPTACEGRNAKAFTVELRDQKEPTTNFTSTTFYTNEVIESIPRVFEVRLDSCDRLYNERNSSLWQCSGPTVDVIATVHEGCSNDLAQGKCCLVGRSSPVSLNVQDIIMRKKLVTRIIGTEMGQVGVSFAVDPGDVAGYRARLEAFLTKFNPRGLHLIPSVVEAVPEVDTFTKLYRKYNLCDYDKRLRNFFSVYSPEFIRDIPALLKQWESREEELMQNLILDNGPELCDINFDQRLTAYLAAYDLRRSDLQVSNLLYHFKDDPETFFSKLCNCFGPEPDPRTYLFTSTHYSPAASVAGSVHAVQRQGKPIKASEASASALHPSTYSMECIPPPRCVQESALAQREGPHFLKPVGLSTTAPIEEVPQLSTQVLTPIRSLPPGLSAEQQPGRSMPSPAGQKGKLPRNDCSLSYAHRSSPRGYYEQAVFGNDCKSNRRCDDNINGSLTNESGARTLWSRMLALMGAQPTASASSQLDTTAALCYVSESVFRSMLNSTDDFSKEEKAALVQQWEKHTRDALHLEPLRPGDACYEAAVKEAIKISKLPPLGLHIMTASSIFHREHHYCFSKMLEQSAHQEVRRLALVGSYEMLLRVAQHGVGKSHEKPGSALCATAGEARDYLDDSCGGSQPCAVFYFEPFRHWKQPQSTCMLICDVAPWRTCICASGANVPRFRDQSVAFDSCDYVDAANGHALAVYNPRQVLPRFLLQCTVDPNVVACPSHPDRPVEYYVVDEHAFVCSRCVVLGEYKNRHVMTVEEAAVMARTQVAEMVRSAEHLHEKLIVFEKQLQVEESLMPNAPRRLQAQKEIAQLHREVEERIARLTAAVEEEEKEQLLQIKTNREGTEAECVVVRQLKEQLTSMLKTTNPLEVITAVQHAHLEQEMERLRARVQERIPQALQGSLLTHAPPREAHTASSLGLNESHVVAGDSSHDCVNCPPERRQTHPEDGLSSRHQFHPRMQRSASRKLFAPRQRTSSRATTGAPNLSHSSSSPSAQETQALPLRQTMASADSASVSLSSVESAQKALSKGWNLLQQGDARGAQLEWEEVAGLFGEDHALGAKARSYLAEAIQKDYESAARWYARCIELDPNDRLSAYNNGVLLEALLGDPVRALVYYDKAAALGDQVAAARAQQLRSSAE